MSFSSRNFLFLIFEGPLGAALGKGPDLISNWTVLLAAALLTAGTAILLPRREGGGTVQGSVGAATVYFDAAELHNGLITGKMGRTQVYITNRQAYDGNGVITITDNVGQILLYVPKEWNVVTTGGDNLGRVHVPAHNAPGPLSVTLSVSDNLGVVDVIFC